MTDPTTLQPVIQKLQALEADLCARLLERDEVVRAALVALIARQHLVSIGAPGTGTSMLVALIGERIAPASGGGLTRFIWLLTRVLERTRMKHTCTYYVTHRALHRPKIPFREMVTLYIRDPAMRQTAACAV